MHSLRGNGTWKRLPHYAQPVINGVAGADLSDTVARQGQLREAGPLPHAGRQVGAALAAHHVEAEVQADQRRALRQHRPEEVRRCVGRGWPATPTTPTTPGRGRVGSEAQSSAT